MILSKGAEPWLSRDGDPEGCGQPGPAPRRAWGLETLREALWETLQEKEGPTWRGGARRPETKATAAIQPLGASADLLLPMLRISAVMTGGILQGHSYSTTPILSAALLLSDIRENHGLLQSAGTALPAAPGPWDQGRCEWLQRQADVRCSFDDI